MKFLFFLLLPKRNASLIASSLSCNETVSQKPATTTRKKRWSIDSWNSQSHILEKNFFFTVPTFSAFRGTSPLRRTNLNVQNLTFPSFSRRLIGPWFNVWFVWKRCAANSNLFLLPRFWREAVGGLCGWSRQFFSLFSSQTQTLLRILLRMLCVFIRSDGGVQTDQYPGGIRWRN